LGLSILTFIISILVYIGDFFYSLFKNMAQNFVDLTASAIQDIFTQYDADLSGWGIYAPLLFVITIIFGAMLSLLILEAGKMVEDFE